MSAVDAGDDPVCAAHPEDAAGWRCDAPSCGKHLCGKCTAKAVNQFYCGGCGATASQLVVPRRSRPYAAWLVRALLYPVTRGLLRLAIIAIALGVVGFTLAKLEVGPAKIDLLRGALVVVYLLVVADAAARGDVPERGGLVRLGRGLVATVLVWLPAALYLWLLGIPARGLTADKILWLYGGLAVIYVPIAVATASTDASYADAANPFKLFELAWQLGRRFVATFVAVLLLGAATYGLATSTIDKIHHAVPTPVVTDIAALLPLLAALTVLAYIVGLLPFVHGDRFGWGDASLYADPLQPKLVAEARRKNLPAAELDAEQSAQATSALAERNDVRKIVEALKEDNMLRALKTYETRITWSTASFDEAKLLLLGKGATRAKKNDLAKRILEDALARSGRGAGHVLVALAQLAAQMGDAATAEQLYKRVVAEHPSSEAAKAAALKLQA